MLQPVEASTGSSHDRRFAVTAGDRADASTSPLRHGMGATREKRTRAAQNPGRPISCYDAAAD